MEFNQICTQHTLYVSPLRKLATLLVWPIIWTPPYISIVKHFVETHEMTIVSQFSHTETEQKSKPFGMHMYPVCGFQTTMSNIDFYTLCEQHAQFSTHSVPPLKADSPKTCINPVGATHFLSKTKDLLLVMPTKLKIQHGLSNKPKLQRIFCAAFNLDLSQLDSSPESRKFHRFPPGFLLHFVNLPFKNTIATNSCQKHQFWVNTDKFSWYLQPRSKSKSTRLDSSPKSRKFHQFPLGFLLHFVSQPFIHKIGTNVFQKQLLGPRTEGKKTEKLTSCWCHHFSLLTEESDKRSRWNQSNSAPVHQAREARYVTSQSYVQSFAEQLLRASRTRRRERRKATSTFTRTSTQLFAEPAYWEANNVRFRRRKRYIGQTYLSCAYFLLSWSPFLLCRIETSPLPNLWRCVVGILLQRLVMWRMQSILQKVFAIERQVYIRSLTVEYQPVSAKLGRSPNVSNFCRCRGGGG